MFLFSAFFKYILSARMGDVTLTGYAVSDEVGRIRKNVAAQNCILGRFLEEVLSMGPRETISRGPWLISWRTCSTSA